MNGSIPLLKVDSVTKSFSTRHGERVVLDGIDLEVHEGEIVALLGKSGSGKSTLLRIIAGLLSPTLGHVEYQGQALAGVNPGTSLVFQTFALMPWLTVQENVELGLEARLVSPDERRRRALEAIDLIGLDGSESAYPKELSGGMRQRVGFARALVTDPDVLLMDEPFSALDVLTAENLRGEILELWDAKTFPTRAIVVVTHNIEEAAILADRVVVLGTHPGRIKYGEGIHLPRPRDRHGVAFEAVVDRIYSVMTGREAPAPARPVSAATPGDTPLPTATVDGMSGLADLLHEHGDRQDLGDLSEMIGLEVDDLLPLTDALVMLGFANISNGQLALSQTGIEFSAAHIQESKEIFARQALAQAPLVATIRNGLDNTKDGHMAADFFRDVLQRSFTDSDAEAQLRTAIRWGRYGELYEYDEPADRFALELDT